MNYLAHLFLAKPTADSHMGNLLGDFCRGVDIRQFSAPILAGLDNHRRVDRFTDSHPQVRAAKALFSSKRRRFAGIALDVLFDHFLIRHWHHYSELDFAHFCELAYQRLDKRMPLMPERMQKVVGSMINQHWFASYAQLDGVGFALDRIAGRIRFSHEFAGSLEDIERHYLEFDECFRLFFPALRRHIEQQGQE
ncbi:DUF479 domain-containing protein [Bowmanella sp. Y26]|uniref:acyl carrier protein phosphodiesterase n=1 Tax=Bowmanella yangjiangensis TaxID=2811230 RepID=UPI001BDCE0C0|nr:ACP phosphodiesterase [Bowmanella yangjiangensis]MBT1062347.1 DUF479 domain-containing protein [Bowmanella yangjiangensis]